MNAPACPFRLDPSAADIHREADDLRRLGPAARVELPGGVQAWSVTDPALIKRLLTDPRISKDAHQHWPAYLNGEIPEDWPLRIWVDVHNALTAYGPEHTRLRRLIGEGFTARKIRAMAPAIEKITAELLDTLEAAAGPDGSEPVDLRARFAWVLPLLVVNTLLGVPEEMHDEFRASVGQLFNTAISKEEALANYQRVYSALARVVEIRTEHPGPDIASTLIGTRDPETGAPLEPKEILDSLLLLIGAGHETTVNLLDHSIVNLLDHPEQLEMLRAGEVAWPDAVEEMLRHQAPIATIIMRYAIEDVHDEQTGATFAKGDAIAINYAAAGRDPGVHGADRDRFDITRAKRREHLSFGHGTHFCLGAELARLEARIALPALFERFPGLTLDVPSSRSLVPVESFISNGHQELPVRLRR